MRSEAVALFLQYCGSREWAEKMADGHPYLNRRQLLSAAEEIWWHCTPDAWREAFHRHPKIGEVKSPDHITGKSAEWSSREQSQMRGAPARLLRRFAELNAAYEKKFGYIFIICASGKNAGEMWRALQKRMHNDPAVELRIAAEEQLKITLLRLKQQKDVKRFSLTQ